MVTVYFKSNANCVFIVIFTLTIVTSPPAAVPISSLDPVVLVEGQSYRQAASCRSVARPPPRLTWDTDLNGQAVDRSSDNGAVSSHFSLHPLRNMNGKTLDCLVWHPTMTVPRRLTNQLVVHCEYPSCAQGGGGLSCGGGWGSGSGKRPNWPPL